MEIKNIGQLLDKVRSGKSSADEEALLAAWLHQYNMEGPTGLSDEDFMNARANMLHAIHQARLHPVKRTRLWYRLAGIAAAVILMVFGAGLYYYINHKPEFKDSAGYSNDVSPGRQGATLTLANGKRIRLTDAVSGEIAKEAGISVTKTADGQLIYEMKSPMEQESKQAYNTLTTSRGESYILILPDRSKVWLNAASSLTYPANLGEQKMRKVRLEGEAYFEISKNKEQPFKVESRGQEVEVLGTHFNINSYADERTVTTSLLEGSVKVIAEKNMNALFLKPGQQSRLSGNAELDLMPNVDVEEAVAWKKGYFQFNGEDLHAVMRQLTRWYNVEVDMVNMPHKEFYGAIRRDVKLSQVLKMLELTGKINFKIEVENSRGYEKRKIMIR